MGHTLSKSHNKSHKSSRSTNHNIKHHPSADTTANGVGTHKGKSTHRVQHHTQESPADKSRGAHTPSALDASHGKGGQTLRQMNIKRAAATVAFALLLFAATLFPALHLECTAAVAAGCLLGAMQGAGAAGLCAIARFIKDTSPTVAQLSLLAGAFLAALVTGLTAFLLQHGYRQCFSPIALLKCLASCAAGFAAFYACQAAIHEGFQLLTFLASDALKCVAVSVASAALRPAVQSFLFPKDKLEDEMREMTAKLKKH